MGVSAAGSPAPVPLTSKIYKPLNAMGLRALVLVCFFLSGATGLLYQVLWTRLLGGVIGNTHFSFTIVVSVFMGGLALGSWLGGRLADRSRNPLPKC